MKTSFTLMLSVITLTSALTFSRPSSAAIGALSGNVPLVLRSVALLTASAAVAIFDDKVMKNSEYGNFGIAGGAICAAFAIVTLDGEQGQVLEFTPVNTNLAKELNITPRERDMFNREIDQANSILQQISLDLEDVKEIDAKTARDIWEAYSATISPETMRVIKKIGKQMSKR